MHKKAALQLGYLRLHNQTELADVLAALLYAPNLTERQQEPIYLALQAAYKNTMFGMLGEIGKAFAEAFKPVIEIALLNVGGEVAFQLLGYIAKTVTLPFKVTSTVPIVFNETKNFFRGTRFSKKVLDQMKRSKDMAHSFPQSVDVYATKYGRWSLKTGGDSKKYQ